MERLFEQMENTVIGQKENIRLLIVGLLVGGHVLLEGAPGIGKTKMVRTLAQLIGGEFRRIQFTPDMMPSDITGSIVFNMKENEFITVKGPIFTHFLLADEINRTPPKTQAALLEAMAEEQETQILKQHTPFYEQKEYNLEPILTLNEILQKRRELAQVHVEDSIVQYITQLIRKTRDKQRVQLGASPRAGIAVLMASKAWALLEGRSFVIPDDVKMVIRPALRHRIILAPQIELEGGTSDQFIQETLGSVPVPR